MKNLVKHSILSVMAVLLLTGQIFAATKVVCKSKEESSNPYYKLEIQQLDQTYQHYFAVKIFRTFDGVTEETNTEGQGEVENGKYLISFENGKGEIEAPLFIAGIVDASLNWENETNIELGCGAINAYRPF